MAAFVAKQMVGNKLSAVKGKWHFYSKSEQFMLQKQKKTSLKYIKRYR